MFAIGCIQAQACHTNHCPIGVATQDPLRQRALVVPDKAQRVANFHRNTLRALGDMAGAAGLDDPRLFLPHHFMQRDTSGEMLTGEQVCPYLPDGFLLAGRRTRTAISNAGRRARPDSFAPPAGDLTESSRLAP